MASSPDPLGLSDENLAFTPSPSKTRASSVIPCRALAEISGNSAVQEFYISTPTPKQEASSPWRLRMTLEAKPVKRGQGLEELKEETIVTKVPLKGGDGSSPIDSRRGRGRSGKSLGSPVKRTGTPKPKVNRRKTVCEPAEAIVMLDSSPFAKPGDAFPKRRAKKSPSPSKPRRQITPDTQLVTANDAESRRKRSWSRKRRTEITPMKLSRNLEDHSSDRLTQNVESPTHKISGGPSNTEEALNIEGDKAALQSDTAVQIDTLASFPQKSILQESEENRETTPDPTEEHHDFDTILESEGFSMVSVESLSSTDDVSKSLTGRTGGIRLNLPTHQGHSNINSSPSQHHNVHGYSDISSSIPSTASPTKGSHLPAHLRIAFPKSSPSVLQSVHGYSDISSVPAEAPISSRVLQLRRKKNTPTSNDSPLVLPSAHGYSDISSMPSDQPSYLTRDPQVLIRSTPDPAPSPHIPATPMAVQNTSFLRSLDQVDSGRTRLEGTKRAGAALQGLLNPKERTMQNSDKLGSPFQLYDKPSPFLTIEKPTAQRQNTSQAESRESPAVKLDNLFDDFGGENRRELKAGLRLGEELARRQIDSMPSTHFERKIKTPFTKNQATENVHLPCSRVSAALDSSQQDLTQSEVDYPSLPNHQLPSPVDSVLGDKDYVSRRADKSSQPAEPVLHNESNISARTIPAVAEKSFAENTTMAKEAEWQRQREAVSKEIQLANTSEVIVISSDDSAHSQEPERSEDAFVGFTSGLGSPNVNTSPHSQTPEMCRPADVATPRRFKLPSPEKRSSGQVYDTENAPEAVESELFWQPDKARTRAAKKRQKKKRNAAMPFGPSLISNGNDQNLVKGQLHVETPESETATPQDLSKDKSVLADLIYSASALEGKRSVSKSESPHQSHMADEDFASQNSDWLEEYQDSEETHGIPLTYRSNDITQDNLRPDVKLRADETSTSSSTEAIDGSHGWSSQGLTFIDPELFCIDENVPNTTTKNIATQTSTVSSTALKGKTTSSPTTKAKPTATSSNTVPPNSSVGWFSTLTSLFNPTPDPIPWFNSATSNLPPATRSDILASSPNTALSPTTPWTKAHQSALLPLYQSSWLFGAHIFVYDRTTPSARYENSAFTTPLGWSRKISASDTSVADASMIPAASDTTQVKSRTMLQLQQWSTSTVDRRGQTSTRNSCLGSA